ncbi:MAG: thioesterase superfamily protein [Marmoricola sp.]|nr:thioesterase superfamily protein [Marmoricola sp.]
MSRAPFEYRTVDMSDEEYAQSQAPYSELTGALRRLNEISLRTTVDHDTVRAATREVEALTARLEAEVIPANFGVVVTTNSRVRSYGNAVVGQRNPFAPPLTVVQDHVKGGASSEFFLNALYEGPPGKVHGGVLALVLDQIFGEAAAAGGTPGMTGTLTLRYRKPTALGACSASAWVDSASGIKTIVKGWLKDAEGDTCVEAEGLFILPRWARDQIAASGEPPPQYE